MILSGQNRNSHRVNLGGRHSGGQLPIGILQCLLLLRTKGTGARRHHIRIGLHLLDNGQHAGACWAGCLYNLGAEGLGNDEDDARQIAVVGTEDHRVIALDQVAQVAIDMGGLFSILGNGQKREICRNQLVHIGERRFVILKDLGKGGNRILSGIDIFNFAGLGVVDDLHQQWNDLGTCQRELFAGELAEHSASVGSRLAHLWRLIADVLQKSGCENLLVRGASRTAEFYKKINEGKLLQFKIKIKKTCTT